KVNNNTTTSSLSANARAQLTGKIAATGGYSLTYFKIGHEYDTSYSYFTELNNSGSPNYASYNHALTLGLEYAALHSMTFGCSYQRYSQGADVIYHVKYNGNSIEC